MATEFVIAAIAEDMRRIVLICAALLVIAVAVGVGIGYKVASRRPDPTDPHLAAGHGVGEAPGVLPPGPAPEPGKMARDPLPPSADVGPPEASEGQQGPFVLVRVTDLAISLAEAPARGPHGEPRRLLNIHVEGVVPKSGYLAEMLLPCRSMLAADGYDEYIFQAIPNVEEGVVGPTRIVADGQHSFDPHEAEVKGVRVFGADGTRVERPLPATD